MTPARRRRLGDAPPPPDPRSGIRGPSHSGLLLSRYLGIAVGNDPRALAARAEIHEQAIEAARSLATRAGSATDPAMYRRAFDRWRSSLPAPHKVGTFSTRGRLILGLGGHHVLEAGLTLHHTYGVPVLPGTALKGLAAHYGQTEWGSDPAFRGGDAPGEAARTIFGTTEEGGLVRFHDAWIDPDGLADCLRPDVLTPHHPAYYSGSEPPSDFDDPVPGGSRPPAAPKRRSEPPSDFDDPVPVPFLSVQGAFLVAISADPALIALADPATAEGWLDLAFDLLTKALGGWGIGGKTSSGYGRLEPDAR